ncbi:winged helix-turn-helix transcriptional regulator [Acidiplasma sp.]|uniref:winged helix-turn-helix transcriptional regulator n=1 Tax=Acidiplasma sp. TaxID=1872114 RepID=UPI00258BD915|nr:winged helix-turn-helix transcriptional regulator [Acidiplasma sp.]
MSNILDKQHAVPVLIKLLEGNKFMTELSSVVSNYSTLRLLIRDLQDNGLVIVDEIVKDKRKVKVSLTEKGRAIANKLKEAQEILESNN